MLFPDPGISVVIPVLNGESTLGVQLEALSRQVNAPPFEVIVADNGSTDATRAVAESYRDRLKLRVVDASDHRGPSFARNTGAEAAMSHYFLFCDADDRVASCWIAAMARGLKCHALVTGPEIYVNRVNSGPEPRLPRRVPTKPRRYLEQFPFAPSSNLAIRSEVLRVLGGFDLELRCAEDADLTIRAQVAGHELGWAQDAVVFHARRGSLFGAARQFFRYGYYSALMYRKLRGAGLSQRRPWQMLRPYLVLAATPYRLFTPGRWSWVVNASQRAGRIVGSVRFRVFCP